MEAMKGNIFELLQVELSLGRGGDAGPGVAVDEPAVPRRLFEPDLAGAGPTAPGSLSELSKGLCVAEPVAEKSQ